MRPPKIPVRSERYYEIPEAPPSWLEESFGESTSSEIKTILAKKRIPFQKISKKHVPRLEISKITHTTIINDPTEKLTIKNFESALTIKSDDHLTPQFQSLLDQLCIQKVRHVSKLSATADILVCCVDRAFPCHISFLSNNSEFFKKTIAKKIEDRENDKISLSEPLFIKIDARPVETFYLLSWLYESDIDVSQIYDATHRLTSVQLMISLAFTANKLDEF